jgi:transposase-like protein
MPPKRKSYTTEFKLKVVKYAEENGNRSASREYSVDESIVRDWRKNKNVLNVMPRGKRARRGSLPYWPELESELKQLVITTREEKRKVSTVDIRLMARKIAIERGIDGFRGGINWCYRFMKRNQLSVRAVTSVGQPLPTGWEEKVALFRDYVSKRKENVDLSQFGNMDEVPVSFDMPDTRTVDVRGKEDIILTTTGSEKTNFTVVLCCTADGAKCEPMVIFKRKTMPKGNFPKGIVVTVSPKGWMNEEIMGQWLEKVWRRRKGSFFKPKSLLIYDSHRSHLTPDIKQLVQKYSQLAVIPGGLTKKLQPLDLSVNKSFKNKIRKRWENWMVNGIHTFTKTNRMKRATYEDVCNWVLESWNEVTPECVKNGFKRSKLHVYSINNASQTNEDNSDNDYDDTDSDNCDDKELVSILTPYSDILEAFNFESDEDFDGFE